MIVLTVFEPSGAIETSLDVDGVSTWQESPNIILSTVPATEAQAAMLADWQARQVPETATPGTTTILTGSGPPDDSIGFDGDVYVDQDSKFTWTKSGGTWPVGADVELPRA